MNKLSAKRILITCILICVCVGNFGSIKSSAEVTEAGIKQKESQIESAKQEREGMKNNLTDLQKVQEELKASKKDLNSYVKKLDESLTGIQQKINELESKITAKEQDIQKTQTELEKTQAEQQAQYEAMKARIKFMYERGDSLYLELLLESGSFAEMLNKAEYVEMLSEYDRNKLNEYINTAKMIELTKEELEQEKSTLTDAKADVAVEQVNMQTLINDKTAEIGDISANITDKQAAIDEYEASIQEQNDTISALEKAVAEEKKQLEAQQKKAQTYDGGMFTWPCPSYTRISDDYGNRIHPILGIQQFHNGIDMAAPGGSPILAAYNGTVVAAAYSTTMGNYVMIDHGDGLYTVYMHASSLNVSTGQTVSKGDQIAAVGATGRATGNHLHFSVRLNGSYVNPWNYLK
ncbi:MAG: peptidoglycan DD-metalloendopeptidase family protein [Butyrivibrio sp.]|nr:peptidoglycan DD-metalloendopeptidase family protein [Butyrivibrio sp.]